MDNQFLCICSGGSARGALKKYSESLGLMNILVMDEVLAEINSIQSYIDFIKPKCIFIDSNLNDFNNINEICKSIKSNPTSRNTPLIILSDDHTINADCFLSKPFMKKDITEILEKILYDIRYNN
jgi:CheY-like chemotaxis protein